MSSTSSTLFVVVVDRIESIQASRTDRVTLFNNFRMYINYLKKEKKRNLKRMARIGIHPLASYVYPTHVIHYLKMSEKKTNFFLIPLSAILRVSLHYILNNQNECNITLCCNRTTRKKRSSECSPTKCRTSEIFPLICLNCDE